MTNQSTLPKILAERLVARSRIFQINEVDLQFSNGELRTFERTVSRGPGSVMAIPLLDEHTVLLIREYAVGVERYELTLPKGVIESHEDPLLAANREMMEEVGYGANRLTFLKEMTANPGYSAGVMHCVIAQDLYRQSLPGDEPEPLQVVPYRLQQLEQLVMQGEVTDGRTIAALYMTRDYLAGRLSL